MNSVAKGRVAEAQVVGVLVSEGWEVYLPTFGNGYCDLIAMRPGHLLRVETKYVSTCTPAGSYEVSLRQVRANRSVTVVKKFNSDHSDVLAVYVAPINTVVFFRSSSLHGRNTVSVNQGHLQGGRSLLELAEGAGVEPTRPVRP